MQNLYSLRSTLSRPLDRRGVITVLAAVFLVGIFAFTVFSVDLGYMALTKGELQGAADASAHAAGLELKEALALNSPITPAQAEANARQAALDLAAVNPNGNHAATVLDGNADVRVGNRTWDPAASVWVDTWGVSPYNLVEVTAKRDPANGTELPLFFGPTLGHATTQLTSQSVNFVPPGVGFEIPPGVTGGTVKLLPITLDLPTWNELLDADPNDMPDDYSYDPATGNVTSGSDGIPEVNLYPSGNSNLPPGNRGTVDIGHPGNSTADLKRQILHGVNEYDLSFFPNGQLIFDPGPLILNGDTGLSAGIKSELAAIIGQPRAIPLFIEVTGNGNNANYTIFKFVGVRLLKVKLTGPMNKKHVIAQPCAFTDSGVIAGQTVAGPDAIHATPKMVQ